MIINEELKVGLPIIWVYHELILNASHYTLLHGCFSLTIMDKCVFLISNSRFVYVTGQRC